MNVINTVIIGMGKMGKIRYDSMKAHGGYNVLAICDVSEQSMTQYGEKKYTDWKKCVDEIHPQAVMVCTYNNVVADIVCYCLNAGIHVFSEKPPGKDFSDTMRMSEALKASDRVLKFGFNHRYHNSVIEARTLIDSGLLGDLVCARGVYGKAGSETFATDWRNNPVLSGGGILLDQGIHMLDLLCYFLGKFATVSSSLNTLVWNDMPTEDSAFAILKTQDGKIASLHSSAIQWKHKFDLDLICTNGYIALNGLLTATSSYGEEHITYYRKDLSQQTGRLGRPMENTMFFDKDYSWDYEATEFYNAVSEGIPLKNGTIDDALEVMSLIKNVYSNGMTE